MASDDKRKPKLPAATPASRDEAIDEASRERFPAGDPLASTGITGSTGGCKSEHACQGRAR